MKLFLDDELKIKYLNRAIYVLGTEILPKADRLVITQRKFTLDILPEYPNIDTRTASTPLDPSVKLNSDRDTLLQDPTFYRRLLGRLNFLTYTRLNL